MPTAIEETIAIPKAGAIVTSGCCVAQYHQELLHICVSRTAAKILAICFPSMKYNHRTQAD